MARKTASLSTDTDGFVRDFSSRLRALASVHDLIAADSWSGAGLRPLIDASLAQAVDPAARAIDVSGPDVKLPPDAAQMLALAFHELTMNAVRYGALSSPSGRISVRWGQVGNDVRLRWREAGGPAVYPPHRSGFGRLMIERLVGDALDGTARLDFRPEGLVCDLTFPETRLTAA